MRAGSAHRAAGDTESLAADVRGTRETDALKSWRLLRSAEQGRRECAMDAVGVGMR